MTQPKKSTTATKQNKKAKDRRDESCLLNQLRLILPPKPRRAYVAKLKKQFPNGEQRIYALLDKYGDQLLLPPFADEEALYKELAEQILATRRRNFGANSKINLVHFLATYFIPQLMISDWEE